MKANYRITFSNGPLGNRTAHKDVCARDEDDAFAQAYKMKESNCYREVMVEEIPNEPSPIGIEFETYDSVIKRTFLNYIFVLADSESEARDWYKRNLMGKKSFCIYPNEPGQDEKCSYGRIRRTYFAAGGYGFDAKVDL